MLDAPFATLEADYTRALEQCRAGSVSRGSPAAVAAVVLALLRVYKVLLSPLFTGSCRFYPSCSDYMAEAVRSMAPGEASGWAAGALRVVIPSGGHGVDPVPHPSLRTWNAGFSSPSFCRFVVLYAYQALFVPSTTDSAGSWQHGFASSRAKPKP